MLTLALYEKSISQRFRNEEDAYVQFEKRQKENLHKSRTSKIIDGRKKSDGVYEKAKFKFVNAKTQRARNAKNQPKW